MIPEWILKAPHASTSKIVLGSIGWEGDDEYVSFGTPSNDGYTFIKVQLFAGRDTTKDLSPTRAQGYKITCHIPDGTFRIPKKDARCYVLLPEGMEEVPGAGVIICTVSPSPASQFNKDRVVIDYGPNTHVVIKGKSVSLQDNNNQYISVGSPRAGGPPSIFLQTKKGSGAVITDDALGLYIQRDGDAATIFQMTATTIDTRIAGGTFVHLDKENYVSFTTLAAIRYSMGVLGKLPTAALAAAVGPPGGPGTPTAFSTGTFISIT